MVPESQAYMDLLSFEKRLDTTIARKKLEIQEAVKRPLKVNLYDVCIMCIRVFLTSNVVNYGYLYPINFMMPSARVKRQHGWCLIGSCALKDGC